MTEPSPPAAIPPMAARLEDLLAKGPETALLRFSLGNAWLTQAPAQAVTHLERAVALDPDYSAAWKLLGKARLAAGDTAGAGAAWTRGVAVAAARGDVQAGKEMQVFLRRLSSAQPARSE